MLKVSSFAMITVLFQNFLLKLRIQYVAGRSQMFARIVNPDGVRPVFIQQPPPNQDIGQGPSESNT